MSAVSRLLSAVLLTACLAPLSSAQVELFEDVWMKVTVVAKGVQVEEDGSFTKVSRKTVHYMHFFPVEVEGKGPSVGFAVFSETAPGVFSMVDSGQQGVAGSTDLLLRDWNLTFGLPNGATFGGYQAALLSPKTDKDGNLKSATLRTFGGELIDGTFDGVHEVGGSYTTKGKTIPVEKLPFTLEM